MKLLKRGKTKDIFELADGNILLKFKDTVTGQPGGESDPGGNVVVGTVKGTAHNALKVTAYYFELLKATSDIRSHYVSADLERDELVVRPAKLFGKGLEFVVRYVATGSFYKRFSDFCTDGERLKTPVFEVTLKDDDKNDPPVTADILSALGILSVEEFIDVREETLKICEVVRADLLKKGILLYDIKLEFGVIDGKITLIDEISAGNMRAYYGGKKLSYEELSKMII